MDNVVLVRSREDCKDLLDRFHHVGTTKPFPEVPYSLLITGQESEEVTEILKALPHDKNLVELLVTNVTGKLSIQNVFNGKYSSITKIAFINCGLQTLPETFDTHFPDVQHLVLTGNAIKVVPSCVGNLFNLRSICISHNSLEKLPDTVGELHNLRELYCAHNKLRTLPATLSGLSGSLLRVDVRYNPISTLPPALATFARKASEFLCCDTNLANARKEDSAGHFNELKEGTFAVVNLFGKPSVGKAALARTIVSHIKVHEIRVEKTAGIQIKPHQTEEFKFKIFDTAGDADFLETHLLFTSPDNLYLNVFNLATKGIHGKADGHQLGHLVMWLNSIFVRASNSKSVHVCTHADANIPHPSSLKIGIVQKYPTSECGGTPVIKARKRAPVVQARKVFEVAPDTTRKWMDVLEELLRVVNQRGKLPVIKKEEARRPAERSGVTDYNKSCLMLNASASADHTVYHERVPDVVILDPQWLAVELCAPISFNQDWFGDGILKLTDLERASSGDILPEGGLVVHSLCEQLDECFCFFRPGFPLALLIPKMQRNERQEDGGCAGKKTTSAAEGSCWNSKDNALVGELCIKLDD